MLTQEEVLEEVSKLARAYLAMVKNQVKWSEELKERKKQEFLSFEKNIKENIKIENKEEEGVGDTSPANKKKEREKVAPKEKEKEKKGRWSAKKFFLTYSRTEADKIEVYEYFKNNKNFNIKELCVSQETHEEDNGSGIMRHLHVYMQFAAKKDVKKGTFFDLPKRFEAYGSISANIDTIGKGEKENIFSYIIKEDKEPIYYGFNIFYERFGKLKKKDIWYKIQTGEWCLNDVINYDPCFMKQNLRRLSSILELNLKFVTESKDLLTKKYNFLV